MQNTCTRGQSHSREETLGPKSGSYPPTSEVLPLIHKAAHQSLEVWIEYEDGCRGEQVDDQTDKGDEVGGHP